MKTAKTNQTCFFYAIKPWTASCNNEKSKNLVVREIRPKTALFNCESRNLFHVKSRKERNLPQRKPKHASAALKLKTAWFGLQFVLTKKERKLVQLAANRKKLFFPCENAADNIILQQKIEILFFGAITLKQQNFAANKRNYVPNATKRKTA